MRELHDGPGEGEEKCPGPESCHIFLGAAQDGDEEANRLNRDAACESVGRACARLYQVDEEAEEIVARVEEIVCERDSSRRPVDFRELSPLLWDLVQVWDDAVNTYERRYKRKVVEMSELIAAIVSSKS